MTWSLNTHPSTTITILDQNEIKHELREKYQLVGSGGNFSLRIRSLVMGEIGVYCAIYTDKYYKSTMSRIRVIGEYHSIYYRGRRGRKVFCVRFTIIRDLIVGMITKIHSTLSFSIITHPSVRSAATI